MSEFVSRNGRVKLVRVLLNSGFSMSKLARAIGVTRQAVHLWLRRNETHPCNLNLDRLLDLALETDGAKTAEILLEELETFQRLLLEKCQVGT